MPKFWYVEIDDKSGYTNAFDIQVGLTTPYNNLVTCEMNGSVDNKR